MPATTISDIIVPEIWLPYVQERTAALSDFFQSGIVQDSQEIRQNISEGGSTLNIPNFKDLDGESEVLSASTPLGVNSISTAQQVGVILRRGKAWGSNDLAQALAGIDPLAAIGDLVAGWWARDMQRTLLRLLDGVFAAASMSDLVESVAIEDGNNAVGANKLTGESFIDACARLGDAANRVVAFAVHSRIYHNMLKENLIDFERVSEQGRPIATYQGKAVIVDDSLPRVAGTTSGFKYTSYLFAQGVIGFGEGTPKAPVETDRDILAGEEVLVMRRHFCMHPLGLKWVGTPAGDTPTNAELATGAAWQRVFEVKNVPIVKFVTNG